MGLTTMTYGEFIKTLNQSQVFRFNRSRIAVYLAQAAGIHAGDDAVIKWIDRKVPANIEHYFVDGKLDEAGVISFFRRWTNHNWAQLQQGFDKKENCIVDCETPEQENFYQSLLNQYLMSFGLPLSESRLVTKNKTIAKLMRDYMYPTIVAKHEFQAITSEEERAAFAYLNETLNAYASDE